MNTLSKQDILYCFDMIEVGSGEILTLCGNFSGRRYRGRLAFYPNAKGKRIIRGRNYEKASYETGYIIPDLRKVLDLPGEQHFIIDRSQIVRVYRCTEAFAGLPEQQREQCRCLIDLLYNSCDINPTLHGLTGSGALHSIGPASDYDWVIYTRDPRPVQEFVTSHPEFRRELTFSMQHVYRKYSEFSGLSRSDLDLLFAERWKYFRFEELRLSVSFVDPLFLADEFLHDPAYEERVTLVGEVTDGVGSYQMPRLIPIQCAGKSHIIFTWLFLYNGAFAAGDRVQFSGRKCLVRGDEHILVETSQDYIRKLPKQPRIHHLDEVTVRLATPADIPKIIHFLKTPEIDQSFIYPLSARNISIEERVHNKFPHGFWLIALSCGEVMGCRGCKGLVTSEPRVVEFSTLAVKPEFRGIGLGNLLVSRGVQIALERYSPRWMCLDSWATNKAFAKTVAKVGFVEARRFDDPLKRPPDIQSVEYILDCSRLKS